MSAPAAPDPVPPLAQIDLRRVVLARAAARQRPVSASGRRYGARVGLALVLGLATTAAIAAVVILVGLIDGQQRHRAHSAAPTCTAVVTGHCGGAR